MMSGVLSRALTRSKSGARKTFHSVAINSALEAGDYATARDLIARMRVFEDIRAEEQGGANVPGVKAALGLMGEDCGAARPPAAWPLDADQMGRLEAFMTQAGLI